MLGITVRNVAVVVVLIAASGATIPGVAAPRVSDQPPQHVTATPIGGGKLHVSWLEPLEITGSTTSYRYKMALRVFVGLKGLLLSVWAHIRRSPRAA